MEILKLILRLLFAYGLCLFFTAEFNPLIWSTTAKVWLLIIIILLISND